MTHETFEHLSGQFTSAELALGWLSSVTLFHTATAVTTRPHHHRDLEMILCLKGEMRYEIEGARGPLVVRAGSGIIIPERCRHTLCGGTDVPGERIGFHVARRMSATRQYGIFSTADFALFRRTLASQSARVFRVDALSLDSARRLAALLTRETLASAEYGLARLLVCTILYHVVEVLAEPHAEPGPQMMDEAVRYLEKHFAESISVKDLVRFMGYSRANLFKLFRDHTGLSPNDWLVRYRVRKARELLSDPHLTVAEVARRTGFSDASYFARVFRRYTGASPRNRQGCPVLSV